MEEYTSLIEINENLDKLQEKINSFSMIFSNTEYNNEFLEYLKKIEKPQNNICVKLFNADDKAIRCQECAFYDTSIICLECYEKTKDYHKSHNIIFETDIEGGCCDCGNPEVWKKESFCPEHKGTFQNEEEINNFIKNNFDQITIEKITKWCDETFSFLAKYFLEMERNDEVNDSSLEEVLEYFLKFLSDVFTSNSALMELFFKQFIKNYPFETNHNCVIINENYDTKIIYSDGQSHSCQCSFFKILLSVWTEEISKEDLLFLCLKNNRIKIHLGLIYITIYDKIIKNESKDLCNFINQILVSDVFLKSIKYPFLISNFVNCFYQYLKKLINHNDFDFDDKSIKRFYHDINYLLKNTNLISDNISLFENFINLIELINNINKFEIRSVYKNEGFSFTLFIYEHTLLTLFLSLIRIFNFDNVELVKQLINIFEKKFRNYAFLEAKCYSFHIILVRAFSAVLNRFCFHYSIKNKTNIYNSLKYFMTLIPNYEKIFDILIKEQMKFFGFLLSLNNNYFIYYGFDMKKYFNLYFNLKEFYLLDFNLIKLMLCLSENKKYFTISKILELCNVNDSHLYLINNIFNSLENPNFSEFDSKIKSINLNKNILELFIIILKDDTSIFELLDYPIDDVSKKDELEKYLIDNEQNSIKNGIKKKIISFSMIAQNLYNYADLKSFISINLMDKKQIQSIFEEMTNKIVQNNGEVKFSLKIEYIKQFDLDYILNPSNISSAQRYIIEFKKNEVSLLNNYFYDSFNILKELNANCFYNFFYNNNNVQFILSLTDKLISNKQYKDLSDVILLNCAKLIIIFIYADKNVFKVEVKKGNEDFHCKIEKQLNQLLSNLKNELIKSNDDFKKSIYKYLEINISKYLCIDIKENEVENKEKKKNNNKKLLEKFKKKFKEKNECFIKTACITENDDESEKCILCHLKLMNKEDGEFDVFGVIGINIKDYFINHCKKISIKNEFEKYNKNPFLNFKSYYNDDSKEVSTRILSCNHKIHFNCYNQLMINAMSDSNTVDFNCPLCKKLSNIFIPCHNYFFNEDKELEKYYLGFKLEDFFTKNFHIKEKFEDCIFIDSFETKFQNILNSSVSFIENFFEGKLLSFINMPENYSICFDTLTTEFSNFLIYYHISNDPKAQIEIWTNLIICLRIILKAKLLNIEKFISEFHKSITFLESNENSMNYIQLFFNNSFEKEFEKILFLRLILFDFENSEKFLIELFSPFIPIISFIKKIFIENNLNLSPNQLRESINIESFNNYINNDETNLRQSMNIFLEKIYIFSLINKNKKYIIDNLIKITENNKTASDNVYKELLLEKYREKHVFELVLNLEKEVQLETACTLKVYFSNKIGNKTKIQEIFNNFQNIFNKISIRYCINNDLLLFGNHPKFKFIPIEKTLLEQMAKIEKKKCMYCGKYNKSCVICLLCGEKICDTKLCIPKENNPYHMSSYLIHSINCNSSNVPYITELGQIIFYLDRMVIYSFNQIYLNKFGEACKEGQPVTNDYLLVEKNYQVIEKMFIDHSFIKSIKKYIELTLLSKSILLIS